VDAPLTPDCRRIFAFDSPAPFGPIIETWTYVFALFLGLRERRRQLAGTPW